jgi:O-antigen ligase/tetratricopeptide (TPR) repeat protein
MHHASTRSRDQLLLQIVDGCLAGVIFVVPLLMGGRHAVGQLVLTVLAVTAACAWGLRQSLRTEARWRPTWAVPLLLAGLALVVLQVVPLPPWLLGRLAPRTAELLPLWNQEARPFALGAWPYVSFAPAETRAGLVLFLDFAFLFLVVMQRLGGIEDVERLLRWCALAAVGMGLLGIVQLLAGNGKFLWFYQHPFSPTSDVAKGTFANRNHFAQFLALGIGPLLWWLQDAARRGRGEAERPPAAGRRSSEPKSYLLGLALGIVLFAALLSLSRGGNVALCIAATVCAALCYWASSFSGRLLAVVGAAGLLIGVSLAIFGFDRVSNRLEDLSSGSLERLDNSAGRRMIWAAAAKAAPHHYLLGTGGGSFSQVYPLYVDAVLDEDHEYTHAENCYLQIMLETGFLGLALTLAGIVLCGSWCVCGVRPSSARRLRVCAAAIAASLAATVVHACVDFIWYVPACMAMVAILAACACRVKQLAGTGKRRGKGENQPSTFFPAPTPLSSFLSLAVTAGIAVIGGVMVVNRVGPAMAQPSWDEHLIVQDMSASAPAASGTVAADAEKYGQWINRLENVVRWQPSHMPAHLALAGAHRQLFETLQREADNQMPLANIRDAAIQSHFASREALTAWLARAVGKHWVHLERSLYHTRQALRLCPLEGRGYVYLADLAFLSGADVKAKQTCIEQAVRVRPREGAVLYAAGSEALLAGDTARWLGYAKLAFLSGRRQQERLMGDLVGSAPRENLPVLIEFVLREFQPDLWDLRFLYGLCEKRCPPERLRSLARCRAAQAEKEAAALHGVRAAAVWLEAHRLHGQLGNYAEALACARHAVECNSGDYDAHLQLAACLSRQRMFAEAESHWRWCQQRAPGDPFVETQLREAVKLRLDNPSPATADSAHPINR